MVQVIVVVRELGKTCSEYTLEFDLPEVPRVGDCLSIFNYDTALPYSEDLVVRKVWWHLMHAGTGETTGQARDIMVECDTAIGPYASKDWRHRVTLADRKGVSVENFDIARTAPP